MPEIKNTFTQGKMNLDLDERLIPNGQYREALNVQVSSSDESDVGSVQNVLGNTSVDNIISANDGYQCVGSISDEKNNRLFWFITNVDSSDDTTATTSSAIIEYKVDSDTTTPIVVDTTNVALEFDIPRQITAINIIDDLLFFTDGFTEPKKINIEDFRANDHSNLTTNSNFYVKGSSVGTLLKEHITVVKKKPTQPPKVDLIPVGLGQISGITEDVSFVGKVAGDNININIPLNTFKVVDADIGSIQPDGTYNYTNIAGSTLDVSGDTGADNDGVAVYDGKTIDISSGDTILLSDPTSPGSLPENAQVTLLVDTATPVDTKSQSYDQNAYALELACKIISLSSTVPSGNSSYDFVLQDFQETLFKKSFPRFAYRYKYKDGEYSAFGPFTQPCFLPGAFSIHPTIEPYNSGMETRVKNIIIRDFVTHDIPDGVVEIDLLYKSDNSPVVYSIETINSSQPNWSAVDFSDGGTAVTKINLITSSDVDPSNTGYYKIKHDNIHAALPENQLLRPWDNVPKKAKAQDFTAGRLIYGNYTQNLKLDYYTNNPSFKLRRETRKINTEALNFEKGLESVKSQRTYQAGIVFGDEYGRETPILTGGTDSSDFIPYDITPTSLNFNGGAEKANRLYFKNNYVVKAKSNWETQTYEPYYFKVFIKETASEYYNLVMDRVYRAEEDTNLWISFPSSDRNKVNEDDFIILKKSLESNSQVQLQNKFKIIDIQNEAPDFIRKKYREIGQADGNGDLSNLYIDSTVQPLEGATNLILSKDSLTTENINDLQSLFDERNKLSINFSKTNSTNEEIFSKRYNITSMSTTDSSPDSFYLITLDTPIASGDSWVESSLGVLEPTLKTNFWIEEKQEWQEFQGRFFVKIASNQITNTYLEPQIGASVQNSVVTVAKLFYLGDSGVLAYNNGVNQVKTLVANTDATTNDTSVLVSGQGVWQDIAGASDTQGEWEDNLKFGDVAPKSGWFIDSAFFVAAQPTIKSDTSTSTGTHPSDGWNHNPNVPDNYAGINDVSTSGNLIGPGIRWNGFINCLQGVVTTTGKHTNTDNSSSATLMWKRQTGGNFDNDREPEVYGNTPGKFFMHLSFSGVGGDLMQGVSSIGGYTAQASSQLGQPGTAFTTNVASGQGLMNLGSIHNYNQQPENVSGGYGPANDAGEYLLTTCNVETKPGTVNPELAERQWDPTYNHPENEEIVKNLTVGSKFKIRTNTIDTVFTILSITEKHLYNHTAWNRVSQSDGTTSRFHGMSVNHKWEKFLKSGANNSDASNTGVSGSAAKYQDLNDAIFRFAKPDNRRTCYVIELDKDLNDSSNFLDTNNRTFENSLAVTDGGGDATFMEFVKSYVSENSTVISDNPAVWETEPKEEEGLDIYYEASQAIPIVLDDDSTTATANSYDAPDNRKGHMIAPIGTSVRCLVNGSHTTSDSNQFGGCVVKGWDGNIVELEPGLNTFTSFDGNSYNTDDLSDQTTVYKNKDIRFFKDNLSYVTLQIDEIVNIDTSTYAPTSLITKIKFKRRINRNIGLPYFNCYSFGNGVESNRIRDDFNRPFIKNGVRASTTLEEQYLEDNRTNGLIYSGIYNKNTSLNSLNQFIMAEKITKDLEPTYGSIQKLFARNSDLVAFCEDKVVQIAADKDIIFNADGNPQLTASNKVLGQSRPFVGEYGISKNPESFASSSYRAYFTDKQRGAVLRLSMDGITPISDANMRDWFRDKLKGDYLDDKIIGSYDENKQCYNLTFDSLSSSSFSHTADFKSSQSDVTVTYREDIKGWSSFKSFIPESGLSCVNTYYTFRDGKIYRHNQNDTDDRNKFYGQSYVSFITAIFNQSATTIKNFNTLNYDGDQGWLVDEIKTDLETATISGFINKENRYFTSIIGDNTIDDVTSFDFQGIGIADIITT